MAVEPDPTPGYKRLLVYGDEASSTGHSYSGHGTLWMPWERRGDFARIVRSARETHGHRGSLSASAAPAPLLLELVDQIFRRRWMAFRSVITPATATEAERQRAFLQLVARRVRPATPDSEPPELRLRLSRKSRAPDASGTRIQAALGTALGPELADAQTYSVRAARSVDGVELAELLTSLVVAGWERRFASKERRQLAERVAENLGWGDLAADTSPAEWKFNIWFVRSSTQLDESARTQRAVQLLLPMSD